jgi:hypothetical protein
MCSQPPAPSPKQPLSAIAKWLAGLNLSTAADYRHRAGHLTPPDSSATAELCTYARAAHRDALNELETLFDDPFRPNTAGQSSPADAYPHGLHLTVRKGYLGEVLAAAIIEQAEPFGTSGWEVPVFRFAIQANWLYSALERLARGGSPPLVIGTFGDDCTAFRMDLAGRIVEYAVCEAKCTAGHKKQMVEDAYEKLSRVDFTAIDTVMLIHILERADQPLRDRWHKALWDFRAAGTKVPRRHIMLYVYGTRPRRGTFRFPSTKPHSSYTANVPLEAIELRLDNVAGLVDAVYGPTPPWK